MSSFLDPFIPRPDVREWHEITIQAPAPMVFEAACKFDLHSIWMVRAIFWLRAKILGAKAEATRRPSGFIAEMLHIGWRRLNEEPNHVFIAGAVCRPWQADVLFSPVPAGEFATFTEPDRVKITWTLETEPLGPALTRFATETRAVATDEGARTKFRRYWRKFGVGAVLIRWLVLRALRRDVERRWHAVGVSWSHNKQSS